MTVDEKLAVIAGNLRQYERDTGYVSDVLMGNLYELVRIAAETGDDLSSLDIARLVIPRDKVFLFSHFCRIYKKYYGGDDSPFQDHETVEKPNVIVMPEMARLDLVVGALNEAGFAFEAEYIDSFSLCCEDVQMGNCRYALLPYSDPGEGRLHSFDKMREKYGLKVHFSVFVTDDDGREYGYRLCGLGIPDKTLCTPTRIMITADTSYPPIEYLRAIEVFGANVRSASFDPSENGNRISCDISIAGLDDSVISGLLMYLASDTDLTIDGVYAEIYHKSRGFQNGLH